MTPSQEVLEFLATDYSMEREKQCIALAKASGLEIVDGDDHTLLFDLDTTEDLLKFKERAEFLRAKFAMVHLMIYKSKSGNHHAIATLDSSFPSVDPVLRIAIQACLGSDWKREMLGCLRTLNYQASDSKLFRPQPFQVVLEWDISETRPMVDVSAEGEGGLLA